MPDQIGDEILLFEFAFSLQDRDLLLQKGVLRIGEFLRRLGLAIGDLDLGPRLRQLKLELLQFLAGQLDHGLIVKFRQPLALRNMVQAFHEQALQTRLHDRRLRGQFPGDDAVAPDPAPIENKPGNDHDANDDEHCARTNPPQSPGAGAGPYRRTQVVAPGVWTAARSPESWASMASRAGRRRERATISLFLLLKSAS